MQVTETSINGGTYLCGDRDAQKVNKPDILVTDNFYLVNKAKATKVVTELLLGGAIVQPTEIDIAAGVALADGQRDLARHR
jgi:hypothetical protein